MRWLGFGVLATTAAFLVGASGAPSAAFSTTTGWLADRGTVTLDGPVGDAVKIAFPELDTADPGADDRTQGP